VARAESELAKQLVVELEGNDEAADDELIAQADAIRLAAVLPPNAEAIVRRLHEDEHALMAALTRAAEADAAAADAERRFNEIAPGGTVATDVELLRTTSDDVLQAEAAARVAQHDLGAAAGAVRPEERIALRAAGRRSFDADARHKRVMTETRPLVAAAIALLAVALAAVATAVAGAIDWPAAAALSGLLAIVALVAMIQRHRAIRPARRASVEAEAEARRLSDQLRTQEAQFGDWGVRVMHSMAADDELRVVLERWQRLAGHDVEPERVEDLIDAVAAIEATRDRRRDAVEVADDRTAAWLQLTGDLGVAADTALDPGPTLDLLDRALAVRARAETYLHELSDAEQRAAARSRLADLLRGRTVSQLDNEAAELDARAGDDDGGGGPLLYVDDDAISLDGRVALLQEVGRLGPDGRFVVVTTDPGEWTAARLAMQGGTDDAVAELDLRDGAVAPTIPITESRPWFAS
jgi:hypothetical protein